MGWSRNCPHCVEPEISLLRFQYFLLKNLPLIRNLSRINPMQVTSFCFFVLHFNLPSHLSLSFPPKEPRVPVFLPHTSVCPVRHQIWRLAASTLERQVPTACGMSEQQEPPPKKKSCYEMINGTLGFLGKILWRYLCNGM